VVKFYSDIEARPQAELDYLRLPLEYTGNEKSFHNLIDTYGTHFVRFAKLGAILTIIIGHHRNYNLTQTGNVPAPKSDSVMDMMSSVWLLPSDSTTITRSMNKGGYLRLSGSIDEWAKSAKQHPALIGGTYEPLSTILGKNSINHRRDEAFLEALEAEKRYHELRKNMVALKKQGERNKMQNFIMDIAEKELPYIVVDSRVAEVVNEGLRENWLLEKYWISCTVEPFWYWGECFFRFLTQ
jgi:hypothetical protein